MSHAEIVAVHDVVGLHHAGRQQAKVQIIPPVDGKFGDAPGIDGGGLLRSLRFDHGKVRGYEDLRRDRARLQADLQGGRISHVHGYRFYDLGSEARGLNLDLVCPGT